MSSLLVTLALIVLECIYIRGWYRLLKAMPGLLSAWRPAAFAGGLLALWAVTGSPLAAMDHHMLTAHMAQHLTLMTVSAPLILLGAPVIVVLNGLPRAFARLASRLPLDSLAPHPLVCWLAGAATVIVWHAPALFEPAMRSAHLHVVEQGCFVAAGLLFWWPIIQPWPSPAALSGWGVPLYLFLATLPCDALSAFLTFCGRVAYPHYVHVQRPFDVSAMADQEWAGALMWVWVTFVYLAPAVVVTIRTLSPQRRALNAEFV